MKIIGVLRGGAGKHYQTSINKGSNIISHLYENLSDKWKPVDILIDKSGVWHLSGLPTSPAELKHKVDAIWNLSHPSTHQYLQNFSIPTAGAPHFLATLEHNPQMLREQARILGYQMPRSILLPAYQEDFDGDKDTYAKKKAKEIFEKFGAPWIVKSFTPDSNMGMHVAKTYPELVRSILDGVEHDKSILIEELISGKVAGVHTVAHFRGEDVYAFPARNAFSIADAGGPPGGFSQEEKQTLVDVAKKLHKQLGAGYYLKCDFVLRPRGKVCLLAIDSIPDTRAGSHFHQACESVGVKMHNVIEHILEKVS